MDAEKIHTEALLHQKTETIVRLTQEVTELRAFKEKARTRAEDPVPAPEPREVTQQDLVDIASKFAQCGAVEVDITPGRIFAKFAATP